MATIKSYTDEQQSKKLAKILPLESADMYHFIDETDKVYKVGFGYRKETADYYSKTKLEYIPCWSLTSLLGVLPDGTDIIKDKTDKYMCTVGVKDDIICTFGNNPVDACVNMIIKLNELNLL